MSDETMPCTGASDCDAPLHVHGCYADRRNCDNPAAHRYSRPPSPVQPPSRGRADAAMHIIRRADGEEMGEYAFWATDGPDGWDVAENADHDEDTVYEILACYPVSRRKFLWSTLCETCDGEGDGCPACGGSGECEPPDTEHLVAPAADVQVAPPGDEGDRLTEALTAFVDATTCTTPAYGAPGYPHCAACCYGTLIAASCIEEFEAATLARRLLDNINGAPTAATYDQIMAGSYAAAPPAPAVPVEQAGRRELDVTTLPEWLALVEAVNDDGGTVANYRATVTGRAASLTRAVRALAAAPSPATEPVRPPCNKVGHAVCPFQSACIDPCPEPPPPAAPAVSPEPGHDGHTHDVGPVKVWRCILSAPDCLGVDDANRLHIGCGWVDAVPSPEPERDEHASRADAIAAARWDSGGDDGEDAQMERQYERDHGIEP